MIRTQIMEKAISLFKIVKQHNTLVCEYSPGLMPSPNKSKNQKNSGFTIVELLVVIVVIGILAAITIVSYAGITKKATESGQTSDLDGAKKQLELFNVENGKYPDTTRCDIPDSNVNKCVKFSSGSTLTYSPNRTNEPTSYNLSIVKDNVASTVSNNTTPSKLTLAQPSTCPTGFIPVPGSLTYATSGFCVMKYEAKADDSGDGIGDTNQTTGYNTWPADTYPISASRKLVSTPGGYPVANISQTTAITAASSFTKDCTGCHLISEAEWMTIAQNVLGVASNWSGGTVGSGYIFSGHNDGVPNTALVADANDTLGYAGETNKGGNQKRTLTLTNGEVIWDMAGNVSEWTSGQTANGSANQPGVAGNAYASGIEWPSVTTPGLLAVNVAPTGTGLSGAGAWTSTNGIGLLTSNPADAVLRGFARGGLWIFGSNAGVLSLDLGSVFADNDIFVGLRVSR